MPVFLLAPLGLGAKGCDAAVVGDDCPPGTTSEKCTPTNPVDHSCGGLQGKSCADGEYCKYALGAMCGAADQTGVCAPLPAACDAILHEVCACDGTTYSNECEAARKGHSVSSVGACGGDDPPPVGSKDCGGLLGLKCADGQYCAFPIDAKCGAADQTGVCTTVPSGCREIYAPVCGCDGKNYGNDCEAATYGTSVAYAGKCVVDPPPPPPPPVGSACGGLKGLTCDKGQYCEYAPDASCGAADQTGVCKATPQACDDVLKPVCGCDGKTYDNDCQAHVAGTSVASSGACAVVDPPPSTGKACGARLGNTCQKGEFCNYPLQAICGAADGTGVCEPTPKGCTKEYDPVCGCDGIDYGNACMAALAGVSVAALGECAKPTANECGGIAGVQCDKGQFCDFPIGTKCGAADQMGTCRVPPQACTENYAPVCGCDGKTYSNACFAAAVGASVLSEGACPK